MTRLFSSGLALLSLMAWTPVFANSHCACDEKCAQECHSGKSADCPCKDCGCAKGEGCKHGKCNVSKDKEKSK